MQLPQRPVRTLVRFVARAVLAAGAVWLDLDRRHPEPPRPRPARETRRGDRRD